MTEKEAIKVIKKLVFCGLCTTRPCGDCERKLAKDVALFALEEIQPYREMEQRLKAVYGDCDGLLEKVVEHLEKHENTEIPVPVFKAKLLTDDEVDRWESYKAIGTVEECREAKEKQKKIKPIVISPCRTVNYYKCPACNEILVVDKGFCCKCGQAIHWCGE